MAGEQSKYLFLSWLWVHKDGKESEIKLEFKEGDEVIRNIYPFSKNKM